MKKIFYSFAILSLLFTSCNPLEDIYDELDAAKALNGVIGDVERTLSDDDYTDLDLSDGSFNSIDDAKLLLPDFISSQYPALGVIFKEDGSINEASSAAITYKLYSPIKFDTYTVTDADYTALGVSSLNNSGDYNDFFDQKFPSEEKGTVIDLTYIALAPQIEYTLTDDDFDLVGNGQYNNFDIRAGGDEETIEARRAKIQTILLNNFPDTAVGQQYLVSYAYYDGANGIKQMLIQLDASNNYALINGYTLTEADFALVGNGQYNNFDIRDGKDEASIEARRAKIETILLANFPSAVIEDQYFVTYAIYDGNSGTRNMLVKFDGSGYNLVEETLISKTTRFTLSNKWAAPIIFTDAEYILMGQSNPNFSDRDLAVYNIAIYLRTLYQFAAPEDFVAVEYNYFSGGVSQRNVNFVFDGTVWNAVPTVIDVVLKFGHDGTSWVPDNTIKYTLTNADFALVDNGRYNNFDVRDGKDEETIEARVVKLNIILKANFPASEEGQKFAVTYAVYDGANGFRTTNVKKEGADYILQ